MARERFLHLAAVRKKWFVTVVVLGLLLCGGIALALLAIDAFGAVFGLVLTGCGLMLVFPYARAHWYEDRKIESRTIESSDAHPELWDAVQACARRMGVPMPRIEVAEWDSDVDAAIAGGKDGIALVVNDIRLQTSEDRELGAVIAHEMAHFAGRDILLLRAFMVCHSFLGMMALVSVVFAVAMIAACLHTGHPLGSAPRFLEHAALAGFVAYWARIDLYVRMSFAHEYAADAIAAEVVGTDAVAGLFEKEARLMMGSPLAEQNPLPHHFDHPPLMSRIRALRQKK